jgi:hypothetical protein
MSAADPDNPPEHYNPLLVTVLPKERRARHSYQLAAMFCLMTLGLWQLVIGTTPTSSVNTLDVSAARFLNIVCVVAGSAGILAALIPEHVMRHRLRLWRWVLRVDFDATYFRLWEEMGSHLLLLTIWFSYAQTVWATYGIVKGYSLGLAAALWFGGAALMRAVQIMLTLYRAGTFSRAPSAIVSDGFET